MDDDELLPVSQAAKMLGVSTELLLVAAHNGKLAVTPLTPDYVLPRYHVTLGDARRYLEGRRTICPPNPAEGWITRAEACALLGVSHAMVQIYVKQGKLVRTRQGYLRESVLALVGQRRTGA